jgi:SSS family solute:Na+ symporter
MENVVVLVVIIYLCFCMGIGIAGRRFTKGVEDFEIAGRRMPWGIASLSLVATLVGSGVTIGVGELAYTVGISGVLYPLFLGFALVISMWIAAGRFRKSRAITLQQVLEKYYGVESRVLVAVIMIIVLIPSVAAQFLAGGAIITAITGLDLSISIVITSLIIITYITIGGMWGVALTDSLQMIIIYIGLTLVAAFTVINYGSWGTLLAELPPSYSDWTAAGPVRISVYVSALLMLCYIQQAWLQRSASVKSPSAATKSGITAGLLIFPIGFLAAFAGLLARIKLPGIDPIIAVPKIILETFSPIVGAFFCAAIIAACMSSTDSWIHSSSTMFVRDIYQRLINPKATDKGMLNLSRVMSLIIGILALILALVSKEEVIMLVVLFIAPGALYIGPLLIAWFSPRKLKRKVGFAIMLVVSILGIILTLLMFLHTPPQIFGVHAAFPTIILAYLLTLICVLLPWTSYKEKKNKKVN